MAAPEKEQSAPELDAEAQLLALAALAKQIKKVEAPLRAAVGVGYRNGQGQTFRSPLDGRKLGQVRRNDPDPEWTVTDRDALVGYLRAQGHEETTYTLSRSFSEQELVELFQKLAPEYVAEVSIVPQSAVDAVLAATRDAGEPVDTDGNPVPGLRWTEVEGSLVVTPESDAGDVAARLARAGRIDWSTHPELDAGR